MSIIRVRKDARYFSASNEPFNDTRLSWESRGLMGYLLSKADGWQVRMDDLEKQGPAGNFKLRRMLAELRACGYMNRIRTIKEDKTFDWITDVYESPSQNPKPTKGIIKASGGFPTSGSSTSGKLPDVLSTEVVSTELKDAASPPLSDKELKQVNAKVDAIIASNNGKHWQGRETFRPDHYPLVDWYHKLTGQDCPKSKQKDWHKAVTLWAANNLTPEDLQAAYDMDIEWRKVFTSPNQLTDKAIALRAKKQVQREEKEFTRLL